MWKCEICETQNDDSVSFCYICNSAKPTAPQPVIAPKPPAQQKQTATLEDGTPIPEGRPKIVNAVTATLDDAPVIPTPVDAAPVSFIPKDGADISWETPPVEKPEASPPPAKDWVKETPSVVKPRPSGDGAHSSSLRPPEIADEKPKTASKSRYAARMALRGALVAANIGLIIWNVINIAGVVM